MWRSIRTRLTISYVLVSALAMSLAAALAWGALDRAFLDVLRQNLLAQARRVAQTIEAGDSGGLALAPVSGPYSQAANVAPGGRTLVIDEAGVVLLQAPVPGLSEQADAGTSAGVFSDRLLANLGLDPLDGPAHLSGVDLLGRPEVASALAGVPDTAVRGYRWTPGRRILYAAYPVRETGGQVTSVVYVASPLPRLSLSVLPDYALPQLVGAAGVAGLVAGLAGIVLARQLTQPLRQLTDAVSALARGSPARLIPRTPTYELDVLGQAFNAMGANLLAARDELAAQAHQREAILSSLTDAVLAYDATGCPVLANPAAEALDETGRLALDQAVRRTLATGEPHTGERMVRGQVIALAVTPLLDGGGRLTGAVAVAHDVTAYRQLDGLRTRFVSDVSHELRTPLAAIKGTVETLQDGAADDPAAREQFLATVARETERLIRLTNDLLLLSRADAGRLDLQQSRVDLVSLADRAVVQFAAVAESQHVSLSMGLPATTVSVLADEDRAYQVLVNLLDNALKFTPAGGKVTLSLSRSAGQVACTVSDTGRGIPADELPQLFERFYRGDRARARGAGESGAGLGLAIVKALIEAQGGHVWAESALHEGTTVTFTLPAAD